MMQKTYFSKLMLVAIAAAALTACSDDDNPKVPEAYEVVSTSGAYVLNTGDWGGNNAGIQYIDLTNDSITDDLYLAANGEGLGDLGQDLVLYGSKLYCTVSGSSKIVIMDKNCKVIKSIPMVKDAVPVTPRYMAAANGYVYVTAYDSTVSRIDTTTNAITATVKVGDHPEGIAYANGKLYVNNSGYGSGTTVSVIDEASFTKLYDLTVTLNPYTQCKVASDGNVYLVSNGNYAGNSWTEEKDWVYNTVQRINTATDQVDSICRGTLIVPQGDNLYVLYSEYYLPDTKSAFVLNLTTGSKTEFLDISQFSSPNSMDADPNNPYIYISDAPYGSKTQLHRFSTSGDLLKTFTCGYYTAKVVFTSTSTTYYR